MIVRIILLLLGIVLSAAGAFATLVMAGILNPGTGVLLGDLLQHVLDIAAGAALGDASDATRIFQFAHAAWKLIVTVIVVPTLIIAVLCEIFSIRSYLVQAGVTVALTVALPFFMLPNTLARAGLPSAIVALLAMTGIVAGTLYWLIAGRSAGMRDSVSDSERAGS